MIGSNWDQGEWLCNTLDSSVVWKLTLRLCHANIKWLTRGSFKPPKDVQLLHVFLWFKPTGPNAICHPEQLTPIPYLWLQKWSYSQTFVTLSTPLLGEDILWLPGQVRDGSQKKLFSNVKWGYLPLNRMRNIWSVTAPKPNSLEMLALGCASLKMYPANIA